ncbi:DUF6010 family protein [uncultured Friedmanniella sp.]|uniref:DUF6010 family protein n=1 Tax=uncultured Friedmanniella sp. TaxID=335381 RepID=UPI0035CC6DD5
MRVVGPLLVGGAFVAAMSLVPEPTRRRLNAVVVAGAGAAYLSSGSLGPGELAFLAPATYCAYRGLSDYRWTGAAWLLHTAWDVVHHHRHAPILPFLPDSSFGCAVCDPVIAVWCLAGGRSVLSRAARG